MSLFFPPLLCSAAIKTESASLICFPIFHANAHWDLLLTYVGADYYSHVKQGSLTAVGRHALMLHFFKFHFRLQID